MIRKNSNLAWLAALTLLANSSAGAQSTTVTLYGRVDVNLTRFNDGAGVRMDQAATSRWGLRGSEDLGDGLRAIFQLESRINPDTGTPEAPRYWGREAWVGMRSPGWGTVRLGRTLSPSQRLASAYDPHGTDGIGSFGSSGLLLGHSSTTFVRMDNGVYYETPSFGGFSVFGALALDETPGSTDERFVSVRLRYAAGPVDVSVALGDLSTGNKVRSAGLSYKLGAITPMLQYHSGERAGRKRASWLAGATATVGTGELRAAISKQDDRGATAAVDRSLIAVGYDHYMSKRTTIYGTAVSDKTDGRKRLSGVEFGLRNNF